MCRALSSNGTTAHIDAAAAHTRPWDGCSARLLQEEAEASQRHRQARGLDADFFDAYHTFDEITGCAAFLAPQPATRVLRSSL